MTVTSWQTFNAKMEEVKSAVLAWGEDIETSVNRGKSLIFVGKTGTGKTHLGTAIVMGALRKGFVAKIVDCSLLLSEIYETYGKDDAGRAKGEAAKLIRAYIDLDVLVIDEFMAAYKYDLIPKEEAIEFLEKKPKELEIVLTGRNPDEKLVELADYVSEIKKVKHPFDQGIYARKGIEY